MPLFLIMDGARMIASSILGLDMETVFVGGKVYVIHPPTIRTLAGVTHCMSEVKGDTIKDLIMNLDCEGSCKALSWFIKGDESLWETFMDCPLSEVLDGVVKGFSLIDPQNFIRLSALQRNVRSLIAKPRS